MTDTLDTTRLLALRKVSRVVAAAVEADAREYLSALAPVFRPERVLGDFVKGGSSAVRGADQAWKDVVRQYEAIAGKPPFGLTGDLKAPLDIPGTALEMAPSAYVHEVSDGGRVRKIQVTRPLEWVLSYTGYGPTRLRELLAERQRDAEELRAAVTRAIVLQVVIARQKSVAAVFATLRLPIENKEHGDLSGLPVAVMRGPVPSMRPSDALLVEVTELTGANAFQEIVDVSAIGRLEDPVRERLARLLQEQGEHV